MAIDVDKISKEFDIEAYNVSQSENAILSKVYVVNDAYVVRSRELRDDSVAKFESEQKLISAIRDFTNIKFPELLKRGSGEPYLIEEDLLWTAYPLIKGDVLCSWWNLEKLNDVARKNSYKALKQLHVQTMGVLSTVPVNSNLLADIRRWLDLIPEGVLTLQHYGRLEQALGRVGKFEKELFEKDFCFVHGDYHPGNIVFSNNEVVGLLDTDWSRKGVYLEDLSYTLMTLMRDYKQPEFVFDQEAFNTQLKWYGIPAGDFDIFKEYMLLAVFYDLFLFKTLAELKDKQKMINPYQISFLDDLCKRF